MLDPALSTALSLLAEISLLKDHGVSKIYWLEPTPITSPTKSLFYLLSPTIPNVKLVTSHIKGHQHLNADYSYRLIFVPRSSTLTDSLLESEGIKGSVDVVSWDMGFIPLESDLISLEWDNTFRELWVVCNLRLNWPDSLVALNAGNRMKIQHLSTVLLIRFRSFIDYMDQFQGF